MPSNTGGEMEVMKGYRITGGNPLSGAVPIHGAKNAVLPILAAAAVTGDCEIAGCPDLSDVEASCRILECLGVETRRVGDRLFTKRVSEGEPVIPKRWMSAMRSSILFLGGVLARYHRAELWLPGGCSLGPRPIDLHLTALRKMGATLREEENALFCEAPHGLHGARIRLPFPSVGATETVLIAGSLACGESRLLGAAREPEIDDLIAFLKTCGAHIEKESEDSILIEGREQLSGGRHTVIPDRIAAATYLAAAAVTGGEVTVCCRPDHLAAPLDLFRAAGCRVMKSESAVTLSAPRRLLGMGSVVTLPYPAFPTDLGAVFMAAALKADGITAFTETIFKNRFRHVEELRRMGADITVMGNTAVVAGVPKLFGSRVRCTDLRGGAAVALAALGAEGESEILEISHIERGYEAFIPRLRRLGARIEPLE